ncbi:hypothetical protein Cgig2_001678 [Carnegiea gigantea]|uniref:Uncharacterized protein n=1 Tax=Carnegiea gigantea TaxID=171969 RepID=A0A9Q1JTB8_9CARY|nr:hypothetical protein Cgig2_001678 [Carnegiea gigantea]
MEGINKKTVASLLETFNGPLFLKKKKTCHIMEAIEDEVGQQTPEKYKSPVQVIKEWLPLWEEELKPKEGLQFSSLEECEKFYKPYAHHVGFSGHKSSCKKSDDCMQLVGRNPEKLSLVMKRIQNVVKELKELDGGTSERKISELELFIGSSAPEQIDIPPPKYCHTKGSGKRIKGGKEIAMERQQKRMRLYKACGQEGYHDSHNYQGRGCEDYLKL